MSEQKNNGSVPDNRSSGSAGQRKSTVDAIFDVLTSRTARALVAAQGVLTTAARWLDGRAKVVGELAAKLAPPPAASTTAPPTESPAAE